MVSVSSAVPKLPDGKIDIGQWSRSLLRGHERLQREPVQDSAALLPGEGD